ncbi:uncharacterized protein F4817DRAFT_18979 [Daldinia loculata]|uniref:uncharacterized protein n=1 Tax=Daldinia loculata TaxID=103429 RepID=UPI0020C260D6|nr:uncharacterized protein F4817DRAFT_18979 [Daldinia loculata]KAI1642059.1 hypothetical protein F4817DRAFT_18979 [Daldinia loculata]
MDIIDITYPLDRVACCCARCQQVLTTFSNVWIGMGESYMTPAACPKYTSNTCIAHAGFPTIIYTGPVRLGKERTLVADCHLHDISCISCQTVIGFKCLMAPDNHVLRDGQLFFRPSSIVLILANGSDADINPSTGIIVDAIIQKVLSLEETPRPSLDTPITPSSSEGTTHAGMSKRDLSIVQGQVLDHLQAQLDASREEIQRLGRLGYQQASSSSTDNTTLCAQDKVAELAKEIDELKRLVKYSRDSNMQDSITSLKNGFGEMNLTSTRIERELTSARQTTADLRLALSNSRHGSTSTTEQPLQREIATSDTRPTQQDPGYVRGEVDGTREVVRECVSTAKACAEEVSLLRAELEGLREELAQNRSRQSMPEDAGSSAESTHGNTHH